jgi:hypothetical protein
VVRKNFAIFAPICPSRKADHRAELIEALSRLLVGLASAVSLPPHGGFMGKREPQTILKKDERSIHLEPGRGGQFERQINRLG